MENIGRKSYIKRSINVTILFSIERLLLLVLQI